MAYINHPLLKKDAIEQRAYQEAIIASAAKKNTLVVLPTGLGKTIIALGVAAHRLHTVLGSKVLFLAPTKPLTEQHMRSFEPILKAKGFAIVTGKEPPKKREQIWQENTVFFATPQVVENDIVRNTLSLENFSLVIFDECHRASGDYAYTYMAKKYLQDAKNPLILGLTASPGGTEEKIGLICGNLFIENVEIRSEQDADVREYIHSTDFEGIRVELPEDFLRAKKLLEAALETRMKFLQKMHYVSTIRVGKKDLILLQKELVKEAHRTRDALTFRSISTASQCIKINHALELLQSQGAEQLIEYFDKLHADNTTKAAAELFMDHDFVRAEQIVRFICAEKIEHPKLEKIRELLEEKISGDKKAIVFTQYVTTTKKIFEKVESEKIKPVVFIGQRKGFSQKKQMEILEKFREGEHNVLCATCVAEEGLDIPKVDLVIFYEPIPSEIRAIQRRGRTGRSRAGEIYVLIAKGTIDEAYFWSAKRKEKKMKGVLQSMKRSFNNHGTIVSKNTHAGEGAKGTLKEFVQKKEDLPVIYTDTREKKLLRLLSEKEIALVPETLGVGDFILSDRVCVERKAVDDFLQSIIDGRLFGQMSNLTSNFTRPIMIVEGESLFGQRNIHPNAINGAINSVAVDFRVPIFWTKSVEETAELLVSIATREQKDNSRRVQVKGERRAQSKNMAQEELVAMLPYVNSTLAKRLLNKFLTIKAIANASEFDLREVEGIGEEKAKAIKDIFEREYKLI